MTVEHLRSVRDAKPFVPFVLEITDGRVYRVPHPDYFSISPSGRMVVICNPAGTFSSIDASMIAGLRMDPLPVTASYMTL